VSHTAIYISAGLSMGYIRCECGWKSSLDGDGKREAFEARGLLYVSSYDQHQDHLRLIALGKRIHYG
jgi:hypothetical protein